MRLPVPGIVLLTPPVALTVITVEAPTLPGVFTFPVAKTFPVIFTAPPL
jgi:hypothetical protein